MGFFSKERTGKVETKAPGRRFIWRVPVQDLQQKNRVCDSALLDSFQGVEFHFHLIIGVKGDIGFYLHYKRENIPKYSFYFRAAGGASMRQHTAHTIPQDTERCGHWNVCSLDDFRSLQQSPEDPLEIVFSFDDDFLQKVPMSDGSLQIEWAIPSPNLRCMSPLTSPSFTFNGVFYVIRFDEALDKRSATAFIFSRSGLVPPHEFSLVAEDGVTVLAYLKRTEDMSTQLLKVSHELIERPCVTLRVVMFRGGNPLDLLNSPNANLDKAGAKTAANDEEERNRKYGVAMEDDI